MPLTPEQARRFEYNYPAGYQEARLVSRDKTAWVYCCHNIGLVSGPPIRLPRSSGNAHEYSPGERVLSGTVLVPDAVKHVVIGWILDQQKWPPHLEDSQLGSVDLRPDRPVTTSNPWLEFKV